VKGHILGTLAITNFLPVPQNLGLLGTNAEEMGAIYHDCTKGITMMKLLH
jgi:hypothetical protein